MQPAQNACQYARYVNDVVDMYRCVYIYREMIYKHSNKTLTMMCFTILTSMTFANTLLFHVFVLELLMSK